MNFRAFHFVAVFVLAWVQLFSTSARAQSPYGYPFTITGNTIEYHSADLKFAQSFKPSASIGSGGLVVVDSPASLSLANGRNLPLSLRSVPAPAKVAKALVGFGSKIAYPLTVGVAFYDLIRELNYDADQSTGSVQFTRSSSPVTGYYWDTSASGVVINIGVLYPDIQSACNQITFQGGGWTGDGNFCLKASYRFEPTRSANQCFSGGVQVAPVNGACPAAPATLQDLENSIASKSGWPSSSSVARALNDALQSGEPLTVPAPSTITGPSTVDGPKSTTTTPAQNGNPEKTVTTSTVTNVTYEGPKVITNNVTTTVTNTTVNNVPETTTVTEETEPDVMPADSVNPDLPKLYERKYPDGLTGVWTARKAELMDTPLPKLIGSLSPTIVSSNGCPQFSIPLNLGQWNWGTYALGPPCMVWDFLKVCVLLGAAFLVRALVFGG